MKFRMQIGLLLTHVVSPAYMPLLPSKPLKKLEPARGIEPPTYALRMRGPPFLPNPHLARVFR